MLGLPGDEAGVYPRTGGGNPFPTPPNMGCGGLSPHGRGKRNPASFEEANELVLYLNAQAVYSSPYGDSQRIAQVTLNAVTQNQVSQTKVNPQGDRSIPARAGETRRQCKLPRPAGVYPRTGGGNTVIDHTGNWHRGLSPHGRGKQRPRPRNWLGRGSIPARAGETTDIGSHPATGQVYPRTGGGNAAQLRDLVHTGGLSPHGRGKPGMQECLNLLSGSIPARAGETPCTPPNRNPRTVYPRTGGGNPAGLGPPGVEQGLSPHGRGKHPRSSSHTGQCRSIPARAGETRRG